MTDKQLKIQEAIMIAIHGSIKEAREKEKDVTWCLKIARKLSRFANSFDKQDEVVVVNNYYYTKWKIIWLPPTFSRVLAALYGIAFWYDRLTDAIYWINERYEKYTICDWKLLNEDWSDTNLFDQSEETQDAIYNLLCW